MFKFFINYQHWHSFLPKKYSIIWTKTLVCTFELVASKNICDCLFPVVPEERSFFTIFFSTAISLISLKIDTGMEEYQYF